MPPSTEWSYKIRQSVMAYSNTTKKRKFKAKVTLEAMRGDRTTQEIAAKHRVHLLQAERIISGRV